MIFAVTQEVRRLLESMPEEDIMRQLKPLADRLHMTEDQLRQAGASCVATAVVGGCFFLPVAHVGKYAPNLCAVKPVQESKREGLSVDEGVNPVKVLDGLVRIALLVGGLWYVNSVSKGQLLMWARGMFPRETEFLFGKPEYEEQEL